MKSPRLWSRRTAGAVAAVLALWVSAPARAQDGGLAAIYAERAQYLIPDGGNWEESECFPVADGGTSCAGAWLPEPTLIARGAELASLRAFKAAHEAAPAPVLSVQAQVVAWVLFGVGVVLGGGGVAYLWWRYGR